VSERLAYAAGLAGLAGAKTHGRHVFRRKAQGRFSHAASSSLHDGHHRPVFIPSSLGFWRIIVASLFG
jgi:hypothetical protein